jgi:hypothetical protein
MNPLVGITVALTAGLALGWYVGYVHPNSEGIRRHVKLGETLNRELEPAFTSTAVISLKGIQLLELGMTNEAMTFLSHPLADYYRHYASDPGTNAYRLGMRKVIDQLASTNQIVRAALDAGDPYDRMVPVWIDAMEDYVYVDWVTHSATNAEPVAPHEPPPRPSVSDTLDDRTLDSLPAPGSGGGR